MTSHCQKAFYDHSQDVIVKEVRKWGFPYMRNSYFFQNKKWWIAVLRSRPLSFSLHSSWSEFICLINVKNPIMLENHSSII